MHTHYFNELKWQRVEAPPGTFCLLRDLHRPDGLRMLSSGTQQLIGPRTQLYMFELSALEADYPPVPLQIGFLSFDAVPSLYVTSDPASVRLEQVRAPLLDPAERLHRQILRSALPHITDTISTTTAFSRLILLLVGFHNLVPAYDPNQQRLLNRRDGVIGMRIEQQLADFSRQSFFLGSHEGNLFDLTLTVQNAKITPAWEQRMTQVRESLRGAVADLRTFHLSSQAVQVKWTKALCQLADSGQLDLNDPNLVQKLLALMNGLPNKLQGAVPPGSV